MHFLQDPDNQEMLLRLLVALVIGGIIGLERSFHGRPAGFRTHALVSLSTSLLMLVSVYESHWVSNFAAGRLTLDPTRLAQGIMTGIGFLGAGTIMRDGFTVRGLTTAASIWITAAIGILIGIGFYFPALVAAVVTFGTLSAFRWIEDRVPAQHYVQLMVRFPRAAAMPETDLRQLVTRLGFSVSRLNYHLQVGDFEYTLLLRTTRGDNAAKLSAALTELSSVKEFSIAPGGA